MLRDDREKSLCSRDAPKLVLPPIEELEFGVSGQISRSYRNQHLSWLGEAHYPGRFVHDQSMYIALSHFHLAGMDADSQGETEPGCHIPDGDGASDRSPRAGEHGQYPVASVLHVATAIAENGVVDLVVMGGEQFSPDGFSKLAGHPGRIDDVGKNQADKHPLGEVFDCGKPASRSGPVDRLHGNLTDYPAVMPGWNGEHVPGFDIELNARVHYHVKMSRYGHTNVAGLTRFRLRKRLHVERPAPPRRMHASRDNDPAKGDDPGPESLHLHSLIRVIETADVVARHAKTLPGSHFSPISGFPVVCGTKSWLRYHGDVTREALIEHLVANALRTDGPFTLRSGEDADWYLDARQTTFAGSGAPLVGEAILEVLDPEVDAVGGMTMGADPVAIATAMVAASHGRDLQAFSIRKEEKEHGVGGRLVGPVEPGMQVAMIEDTTTTGSAAGEATDVALEAGLNVVQAIALVDRSDGLAHERFHERGIPFVAIVTPADLGVGI